MKSEAMEAPSSVSRRFPRAKRWLFVFVVGGVLLVPSARAAGLGDILTLFNTIIRTIQADIGGALGVMQTIHSTMNTLHQEVVWPVAMINQSKSLVTSMRAQYGGLMSQIVSIKNNSATLANPIQLELVFRNGQSASIGQLQVGYTNVYHSAPSPTDARPAQRNMVDMDDALALGSLKTAVLSDQTTKSMLTLADSIEQQSATAAPGSAPMLSVQAKVANLETQAYLSKMLAAELRQEAGTLAHQNALLKQSATTTRNLQNQMQQVLSHP
jgi:hypothetical protein